jgi:hypothetical protein
MQTFSEEENLAKLNKNSCFFKLRNSWSLYAVRAVSLSDEGA